MPYIVSTGHILLLGAIAGATIFLGLPVGRMQGLGSPMRAALSALATGILVFLLWDVLSNAVDPIDAALHAHHWGRFSWLAALGLGGFTLGLMSLVYYSEWMKKRAGRRATRREQIHFSCSKGRRWAQAGRTRLTPIPPTSDR
jgi:ZIP family zinc transporter